MSKHDYDQHDNNDHSLVIVVTQLRQPQGSRRVKHVSTQVSFFIVLLTIFYTCTQATPRLVWTGTRDTTSRVLCKFSFLFFLLFSLITYLQYTFFTIPTYRQERHQGHQQGGGWQQQQTEEEDDDDKQRRTMTNRWGQRRNSRHKCVLSPRPLPLFGPLE